MKYVTVVVFLFLFSFTHISAQRVDYLPAQYGQFFTTYSLLNPASNGSRDKLEILSGRQQLAGPWKHISNTFVSAFTRFNDKKNGRFQTAGVVFVADNEGKYLRRSRAYINYSWHTALTKKVSLAAGASMGVFSYRVGSSDASVSGSDMAPDAALGLWCYSKKYFLGVSANQILNSEVTPLIETTRLIRHVNITGGYTWNVSSSFSVSPQFLFRYAPDLTPDIDVAITGMINKIAVVGANYRHHKSMVPFVGIENINLKKGVGKFIFSYAVPVGETASAIQTYELTLGYQVKPPEKKIKANRKVTKTNR